MSNSIKRIAKKIRAFYYITTILHKYKKLFCLYSFVDGNCEYREQYDASIIRLYHTIEKGLCYSDYKPGFGSANINLLIETMNEYEKKFGSESFAYRNALSCLNLYMEKNEAYGYTDSKLKSRIDALNGSPSVDGGVLKIMPANNTCSLNYEEIMKSRHSIRFFSETTVDIELLKKAIRLAQFTPSACNRQGWKSRIIINKSVIQQVLQNQNGNRGFNDYIDKLIIVTADLRAQQKGREVFQAYIDGGMYAESIINSLYYYGLASVPLSAALIPKQEQNIRKIVGIDEAEMLILFIGVGNFPSEGCLTTKSHRKTPEITVI